MADINEKLMNGAGLAELWSCIGNKYGNLVNHCWKYRAVEDGYAVGSQSSDSSANVNGTWYYADSYTISTDGLFVLDNPSSITIIAYTNTTTVANALAGRYRIEGAASGDTLYFSASTAKATTYGDSSGMPSYVGMPSTKYTLMRVTASGEWALVFSEDRNAFPDSGIVSGVQYVYAGVPLENAGGAIKIQTGTYVGTGTYGAGNPCFLTFDFVPDLVFIHIGTQNSYTGPLGVFAPATLTDEYKSYGFTVFTENQTKNYAKIDGTTVSWYSTVTASGSQATAQMNAADKTYYWYAIG